MRQLAEFYKIGRSTVSKILYSVLNTLWEGLSPIYMSKPTTDTFKRISEDFYSKYRFPNCLGCIDERYFRISNVKKTGSLIAKGRKTFLVLQAIVDADYNFVAVEVNSKNETNTFRHSNISKLLDANDFNVPPNQKLPNTNVKVPFVLIGGNTCLKTYLIRPYTVKLDRERKIFNERLEKARVPIHGAFNVLTNKWKCLQKNLEVSLDNAELMFKVACMLHNVIRKIDGDKDKDFVEFEDNYPMPKKKGMRRYNSSTKRAVIIRDYFKTYFVNNPV